MKDAPKECFFTVAGDQQAGGAVPPSDGGALQQLSLLPLTGQPDVPVSLDRLQPSGTDTLLYSQSTCNSR